MLLWGWLTILTAYNCWSNISLCGPSKTLLFSSSPHTAGIQVFSLAWSSFSLLLPWDTSLPARIWSKTFPPLIAVVLLAISHPLSAHPGISYSFSIPCPYLWESIIPPWFLFSLSFCHLNFFTVFSWTVHLFPWHNNYWQPGILSPTVANSRCLENNIRNRVRI